ncbi:MAG: chromosome partitioning protein ParA, partial [Leptospira sp.]|nr:chromosome partitioning protein ParA [Leptospira sp.]
AGISRFKMERNETLKRLDDTKQNLLRIGDIMNSMQKELDLKEKQSERAKAYFKLKTELANADKNLRYLKLKNLQDRLNKTGSELEITREKNGQIMERLKNESGLLESYENRKYEIEKRISDIDKKLMDFISKKEIQKEKSLRIKGIIAEYQERISEVILKSSRESSEKEETLVQFNAISGNIIALEKESLEMQNYINESASVRASIENEIDGALLQIKSFQDKITNNEKRHALLREKLKVITVSLIGQIEERKKEALKTEGKRGEMKSDLLQLLSRFIESQEAGIELLQQGKIEESLQLFRSVGFTGFRNQLTELLSIEDLFRSILFDKDGILAQKESIDQEIEDLFLENENYSREMKELFSNVEIFRNQLERKKEEIVKSEKKLLEIDARSANYREMQTNLSRKTTEIEKRIIELIENKSALESKQLAHLDELKEIEILVAKSDSEFAGINAILEKEKNSLQEVFGSIVELRSSSQKDQVELQRLLPLLSEQERKASALKAQMDAFNEELYNDYSMTADELSEEKKDEELFQEKEELTSRNVKSEIQMLGGINPMAVEEFQNIKEIFDHHREQKEDIEASKRDIEEVLININSESEKLFLETFEIIKANFQETFSTLFNGGRATIELTEKADSLNAGIEIIAEPPGKHVQNLRLLSGGEKSLTVIALLFAIYMVKPSPFCFLDEIDAALDEINKIRFCQILDKFKDKSQFIVVTHAPPTISRAATIFGVTNEEFGISRIVSLKLDEARSFSKKMAEAV